MKRKLLAIMLMRSIVALSQVGINTNNPSEGAVLDIRSNGSANSVIFPTSSNTRSFPSSPVKGMMTFVKEDNSFYFYNGTQWFPFRRLENVAARVSLNSNFNTVKTSSTEDDWFKIPFNKDSSSNEREFDLLNSFNTNNNSYVVPYDGIYTVVSQFETLSEHDEEDTDNISIGISIFVNGIHYEEDTSKVPDHGDSGFGNLTDKQNIIIRKVSAILKLKKGDVLEIRYKSPVLMTLDSYDGKTFFSIVEN